MDFYIPMCFTIFMQIFTSSLASVYNYEILIEDGDVFSLPSPTFMYVQAKESRPHVFKKPALASHLDCPRILSNDTEYIANLTRIFYKDDPSLKTDCASIKSRNYFPVDPNTQEEAEFPIAYARVVYRDYLMLEMELAAEYAPQNIYVYILDRKSPLLFHNQMKALADCFPNVFVLTKTYDMSSWGKNMNYALMSSLEFLARSRFSWKYVIFLQNHDVILRTNYELVQIFKLFNGTNDIEVNPAWPWLMERIDPHLDWTYAGLNLFKNESRNSHKKINFSKGYAVGSLSRAMVEFMLNELNLTKFLAQLENGMYAVDEQLLSTLQADDEIQTPGGFTQKCNDDGYGTDCITRVAFWSYDQECLSGIHRHSVCIMGMEDLAYLNHLPHLTINKFIPSTDFGALICWYEHLFNRTYFEPPKELDMSFYANLNHVRFNHERWTNPKFNPQNFECRNVPLLNYRSYYLYSSYYQYHYFS